MNVTRVARELDISQRGEIRDVESGDLLMVCLLAGDRPGRTQGVVVLEDVPVEGGGHWVRASIELPWMTVLGGGE
jgi:hypothetical protein